MAIQIYNTLSSKKEPFTPLRPGHVAMYVCGPTVYDKAHVGHAMSAIIFDVIRRFLEYRGFTVKHVMNFTDVEDKIIKRSNDLGIAPNELTSRYIKEFENSLRDLNIRPPTVMPKVSDEMPAIVAMIEALIKKQMAYPTADGSVYYRVNRFPEYGKLSHRTFDEPASNVPDEVGKENPRDFALWKAAKPGEPFWESPWGKGRPGWHIECSAMAHRHLGEQIDIHGGGNDLVFPHHENEIAQTEGFTGKPFSSCWVHNGMLQLSGEKMSKSLGNLVTIDDFLKSHDADTFRVLILRNKYRSPLAFNPEVIESAAQSVRRLRGALEGYDPTLKPSAEMAEYRQRFIEAMEDDFNSANASAVIFDTARQICSESNSARKQDLRAILGELVNVLGLRVAEPLRVSAQDLPDAKSLLPLVQRFSTELTSLNALPALDAQAATILESLLKVREMARATKKWNIADDLRKELLQLGVTVEDSKEGAKLRYSVPKMPG